LRTGLPNPHSAIKASPGKVGIDGKRIAAAIAVGKRDSFSAAPSPDFEKSVRFTHHDPKVRS